MNLSSKNYHRVTYVSLLFIALLVLRGYTQETNLSMEQNARENEDGAMFIEKEFPGATGTGLNNVKLFSTGKVIDTTQENHSINVLEKDAPPSNISTQRNTKTVERFQDNSRKRTSITNMSGKQINNATFSNAGRQLLENEHITDESKFRPRSVTNKLKNASSRELEMLEEKRKKRKESFRQSLREKRMRK